jgi:hypothetical protein
MTNRVFANSLSTTITFLPSQGTLTNSSNEFPQVFQASLDATTTFRDYRFSLASSTNVSLKLESNDGNVDLRLYRNLGNDQPLQEIAASTNLGLMPEVLGPLLSAGEYYLRVNDGRSTTVTPPRLNYTLSLGAVTVQPTQQPEFFAYSPIGEATRWKGNGDKNLTLDSPQSLTPMTEGWTIAAVSDWNQDGIADLVWRNASASETKLWLMGGTDGLVRQSEQTLLSVDADWDVVGSADWNQDGFMDLIWRTNAGDQTVVWLMGGTDKTTIQRSLVLAPVPSDWSVKGVADFDRNGTQDILWRNQISGENVVWSMGGTDGAEVQSGQSLTQIPLDWDISGVADWDQDGTSDILWQNTVSGARVVWFMEGRENLTIREGLALQSGPTEWTMRPYAKLAPRILDAIGNNTATALNLGTLRSGEFQDWIGGRDGADLYQFNLTERTRISIDLSALPQGTEIVLLDSAGQAMPAVPPNASSTMTENLEAGQYYIQVKSTSFTLSTYTLSVDAFGVETWLSDVIDAGLRSEIRSRLTDGVLDRTDILSILRVAGDGDGVDAVEFADLTRLSRSFLDLNAEPAARSSDFVGNLLSKVVIGDRANATYKGQTLGDLAAGSTKVKLDSLIDKWFLGGDRPETTFVYALASGRLVRSGIDYKDISQGSIQDSPFLASLAVAANTRSETLSQMFIDNRDGTYTVRFFKPDQTADYVTVDRFLPSDPESATFAYAKQYFTLGGERGIDDPDNELWVALAEKAYAQWLASGWVSPQVTGNRYSNLALATNESTMASILGRSIQQRSVTTNTFESLTSNEFSRPLVFVSKASYSVLRADVLANQSYAFLQTSTNATTGERRYRFFNPWGNLNQLGDPNDPNSNLKPGEIEMTGAEVVANFGLMYLSA